MLREAAGKAVLTALFGVKFNLNLTFNLILYKCRKYGKIKLTTLVGGKT
jgi:hypothetical protein